MSNIHTLKRLAEDLISSEKEKAILTERVAAENKILYDWMEKSTDGIWDWHLTNDYEYMSPRFWEIFGYEPHEKAHHPSAWMDMIDQDDLKTATKMLGEHIASKGKIPYKLKVKYKHKKGHIVNILCRGEVLEWNEDGTAKRMVGTHTDITNIEVD